MASEWQVNDTERLTGFIFQEFFHDWLAAKMPRICAVALCENLQGTQDISFHSFPKGKKLRSIWKERCSRKDRFLNPKTAVICSEHFRPEDFERNIRSQLMPGQYKKVLKEDALPTLKLVQRPQSVAVHFTCSEILRS